MTVVAVRRPRRTFLLIVAVLALLAAPVAARTLGQVDGGRADGPRRSHPSAAADVDRLAARAQDRRARADRQLARRVQREARRTARAVRAARRAGVAVLVDKRRRLPADHRPRDLVVPRVAFLPGVGGDERLLRRPAARALERLFAAARRDGVPLAAVSGFRSFTTQRALFAGSARDLGVRRASRVSARPGHSEHQTGLVMDVAGADGRCAARACFAGTPAARWLARHAPRYGYIVRYPRGARAITGYAYEPWHLRYVGVPLAREVARTGRTLDELLAPRPAPPRPPRPAPRRQIRLGGFGVAGAGWIRVGGFAVWR